MTPERRICEVAWPTNIAGAVRALARGGEAAWLDSAPAEIECTADAQLSMICVEPAGVLEQFEGQLARFVAGGRVVAEDENGWALWRELHRKFSGGELFEHGLSPGWIGYVGFEMARQLERLPERNRTGLGLPSLRMGLFDRVILLDHVERRAYAIEAAGVREAAGAEAASLEALAEAWGKAATVELDESEENSAVLVFEMEREYYREMLHRALEYISAGDIYQVNLAQRLRFENAPDAFAAYCRVRRSNPAAYGALLQWPGGAIGSVSPELFLRLRGREVLTRPIKGTRPRTFDETLDSSYRRELLDSEKDAAELAMIVDLHRNDIGKVCEYGTVRVPEARRVEAHPTVFHTVADVTGRLRAECDGLDLLTACFPAGSISGAPKIRAIEIIDELEPTGRGAYTGAIGALGLDGQMTFNVAIRTALFHEGVAWAHVGGGIVADSDPDEEYEETLAKGMGIVRGMRNEALREAGAAS